jgi:hypothetical protein
MVDVGGGGGGTSTDGVRAGSLIAVVASPTGDAAVLVVWPPRKKRTLAAITATIAAARIETKPFRDLARSGPVRSAFEMALGGTRLRKLPCDSTKAPETPKIPAIRSK